jgi:hypothetical protein
MVHINQITTATNTAGVKTGHSLRFHPQFFPPTYYCTVGAPSVQRTPAEKIEGSALRLTGFDACLFFLFFGYWLFFLWKNRGLVFL